MAEATTGPRSQEWRNAWQKTDENWMGGAVAYADWDNSAVADGGQYQPTIISGGGGIVPTMAATCILCGALVGSMKLHSAWHTSQAEGLATVGALAAYAVEDERDAETFEANLAARKAQILAKAREAGRG